MKRKCWLHIKIAKKFDPSGVKLLEQTGIAPYSPPSTHPSPPVPSLPPARCHQYSSSSRWPTPPVPSGSTPPAAGTFHSSTSHGSAPHRTAPSHDWSRRRCANRQRRGRAMTNVKHYPVTTTKITTKWLCCFEISDVIGRKVYWNLVMAYFFSLLRSVDGWKEF